MSKQISFIHAADLHLDSPFQGLASVPEHIFTEIQASTFKALDRLVRVAIEKDVDFVLLVGDLFDNERQSLKAQIRLRKAFEKLAYVDIPVFISYGNHDFVQGNMFSMSYPDNVFTFPSEQVSHFTYMKDDEAFAQIYGFSYEQRAMTENKAATYKINDHAIPFHIATLHGSLQSNKDHDVYAPFEINDLLQEDFNYWALGHIHKRSILRKDPLVVYPGNTQGRHRNETGEKGCYYVSLTETEQKLRFIPLHAIQFLSLEVDVSHCHEIHEVEEHIRMLMQNEQKTTPTLIDLILTGNEQLRSWNEQYFIEDIIELIHETTTAQKNWQYIYSMSLQTTSHSDQVVGDHFIGQLSRQFDELTTESILKELYKHQQGRKHLPKLTSNEKQAINEAAHQLLLNKLLKED